MERPSQPSDRGWSSAERCALWLALMLMVFAYYYWRTDILITNPALEPYYDRPALVHVRRGLGLMIGTSIALLAALLVLRKRDSENLWVLHAATQLWWIFGSLIVYAAGPVTTPALGLLIVFGLLGSLLFRPRVVLPAMVSGLVVLVSTTVAERMEMIPYAPMFNDLPDVGGRPPDEYVVGTGLVAMVVLVASLLIITYIADRDRRRQAALIATDDGLRRTQTELEETLASLRSSEERFRQLAENGRDVFWLLELGTGDILYLSPNFEEICEISTEEVYANPRRYVEQVHPDDLARITRGFEQYRKGIADVLSLGVLEYRFNCPKSGRVRWMAARAFPISDSEGKPIRIGGLLEDISERRRSQAALQEAQDQLERRIEQRTAELMESNRLLRDEAAERQKAEAALRDSEMRLREQFAELENLYQNAPVGLCLLDSEMRYVRINERLALINGRTVEQHLGRTIDEVIPELAPAVIPVVERALAPGADPIDVEFTSPTPGFKEKNLSWLATYAPVHSVDGEIVGVTVVVQDISELKWAEERARRHLEDLAHVSRVGTLGQMATGLAHELNQPLASIANYAYAGRRKAERGNRDGDAELVKIFDELTTQALRAGEIVHRLRAFVHKQPVQRESAEIDGLVRGVLDLLEFELRNSQVEPAVSLDAAGVEIPVDAVQIQQVIVNLVRNALDAMASCPADERVLAIESVSSASSVEVSVRDCGVGVDGDDLKHLFDAFYTTKSEGMGMGLAISRSIVEAHGGKMWADANADGGMTFRFELPRPGEERERRQA